jgi:lipopolysaccharide transport system permease protein
MVCCHHDTCLESVKGRNSVMEQNTKEIHYIQASSGWRSLRLRELWEYRELLYFLTLRDIKVRYKQTILGAAWAIIQPTMTMIVFSIFFGSLAGIPSDEIPYPIFTYAALVPWTFFANGLSNASNSLVAESALLTKVYFPRLIIPISQIAAGLLDLAIAFSVLIVLMVFYQITPTIHILFIPLFVVLAVITALGGGLWFAALNVQFRDVRYVIPFAVQFLLFASPVAYPSSLIKSDLLRNLYSLNPMVGVIEGFRWALLKDGSAPDLSIINSVVVATLLFVTGVFYFKRIEKTFADVV